MTLDLDFADIRKYPPGESSGIVVFRLRSQDRKTVQAVMRRMLTLLDHESPRGKLWIVEPDRVRIWE